MPWCEECAVNYEAEVLGERGECPECGELLAERRKIPWHLKLLIVATVIYLGWRLVQGITWVVHHI